MTEDHNLRPGDVERWRENLVAATPSVMFGPPVRHRRRQGQASGEEGGKEEGRHDHASTMNATRFAYRAGRQDARNSGFCHLPLTLSQY